MRGLVEYIQRIKSAEPHKTASSHRELAWDGEEHLTLSEIAKKHGIKYATIYARYHRAGLTGLDLVAKGRRCGKGGKRARLVWDGEEHLTLSEIAKKHGVHRQALYYRLKYLGLSGNELIKGFRAARKPKKQNAKEVGDGCS